MALIAAAGLPEALKAVSKAGFAAWLIRRARWHCVDVPVWLAGYGEGLARFGNEAKPVAEGDGWLRRAGPRRTARPRR